MPYIPDFRRIDIHYVHTRASYDVRNKTVIPILLVHGWPGSVREFYDLITLLALPDRDELDIVFEVVAPSLPGFGWSQAARRPGMGVAQVAIVLRNLMLRLGYERFYVQGGDWGAAIGGALATIFPQQVIGFHSNMCMMPMTPLALVKGLVAEWLPSGRVVADRHRDFHFPASQKLAYTVLESGYFHLQATKPDTIGKTPPTKY